MRNETMPNLSTEYSLECVRCVVNAMRYSGLKSRESVKRYVMDEGFSEAEADAAMDRVAQSTSA